MKECNLCTILTVRLGKFSKKSINDKKRFYRQKSVLIPTLQLQLQNKMQTCHCKLLGVVLATEIVGVSLSALFVKT